MKKQIYKIVNRLIAVYITSTIAIAATYSDGPYTSKYPKHIQDGHIIDMIGIHQKTDYTCGIASSLMILKYYFPNEIHTEEELIEITGCTENSGTSLEGMKKLYTKPKWTLVVKEGAEINDLTKAIKHDIPTIIGWSDWGGHWCIPIGYDYRTGKDTYWNDDVIIFRDPYDQLDGKVDCYTEFSIWRFDSMWEESNNRITPGRKNKHMLIIPIPISPQAHKQEATEALKLFTNKE